MILSVSRRTDIPALYSDWFFQRMKEGRFYVRNPMNQHQISRLNISPEVVDCIVFWTKNPEPMLRRLDEISGYYYYFQYTINSYDNDVEPFLPPLPRRLDTLKKLSEYIGKERVIWRYDPIFFSDKYTPEWHLESFAKTAETISGFTEKCVFSFVDIYPSKNSRNLSDLHIRQLNPQSLDDFAGKMSAIAREYNLTLATCAEAIDFSKYGIMKNSCIDRALIERITGSRLKVGQDAQRANCGCVKCDDIGAYDTCTHGCVYCYANYRNDIVREKAGKIDISSPLLCDSFDESVDKITDRPLKSYKEKDSVNDDWGSQITLYDL